MESSKRRVWLLAVLTLVLAGITRSSNNLRLVAAATAAPASSVVGATARARADKAYGQLPLSFEANQGQAPAPVKFLARGIGDGLLLTATEAVLRLPTTDAASQPTAAGQTRAATRPAVALRLQFSGSNPAQQIEGLDELPGKSHYLRGADPRGWQTNVTHYARVRYAGVYPGVDVVYYSREQQLEYDLLLAPGADPRVIKLGFAGASEMRLDASGDLVLRTAGGEVRQRRPIAYQELDGRRHTIASRYVLRGGQQIGFELGAYDRSRLLVIDPVLVYATRGIGGEAVAADAAGNAYITGTTARTDFPTANPLQEQPGGATDAYVMKLNQAGTALVYATYFGGSGQDEGLAVAVDAQGNAHVAGSTTSIDLPGAVNVFGGFRDAFVSKLNADGTRLIYARYLGGSSGDLCTSIAVDAASHVSLVGETSSDNFPVTPSAFQPSLAVGEFFGRLFRHDLFVSRLTPAGELQYSTYLGGGYLENQISSNLVHVVSPGPRIAVDAAGQIYVTGATLSPDFPTKNAIQGAPSAPSQLYVADAFVTKFDPTRTGAESLVYSTYLGVVSSDSSHDIAVDAAGQAIVLYSGSTNLPDIPGQLQPAFPARGPGYLVKLSASGDRRIYATSIGTGVYFFKKPPSDYPPSERFTGLAADAAGNIYLTGYTEDASFPVTPGAFQQIFGGGGCLGGSQAHGSVPCADAFVVKLNPAGTTLVCASFFGGRGREAPNDIAVDVAGNVYFTGRSDSPNSLATPGAVQTTVHNGFLAKISADEHSTVATTVSAASFSGSMLAPASIAALFGAGLAATTEAAALNLPTALAGVTVTIKDSAGVERPAPLFFVSPSQINFQVPPETATGPATVRVAMRNATLAAGALQIATVAPGLFAANADGRGVAAAVVLRVRADGSQSYEPVASFDQTQNRFVAAPIDLGLDSAAATDQVFLLLFGTGLRNRSSLAAVGARIGGVDAPVTYAGPQEDFVGLDQVNLRLPRSLAGRGEVEVSLTADGKAANPVRVHIR